MAVDATKSTTATPVNSDIKIYVPKYDKKGAPVFDFSKTISTTETEVEKTKKPELPSREQCKTQGIIQRKGDITVPLVDFKISTGHLEFDAKAYNEKYNANITYGQVKEIVGAKEGQITKLNDLHSVVKGEVTNFDKVPVCDYDKTGKVIIPDYENKK